MGLWEIGSSTSTHAFFTMSYLLVIYMTEVFTNFIYFALRLSNTIRRFEPSTLPTLILSS